MNVELLREIAAVIQEKPRQFNIRKWHKAKGTIGCASLCEIPEENRDACGTVHCIAGWAQVLSPDRNCKEWAFLDGMRVLELDEKQARLLFYADNWPRGFGLWKATAQQAAARIEHFIATDGRE